MNGDQVIDLGIKFVRGWDPAPPVPGPGTDVTSGLAQTGDFNIALIAGLVLLACALVGFCAYAFIKNKQLVSGAHASNSAFAFLNFSNFSLHAKIISALVAIVAIACIVCGCFSTNAHAVDGADNPLVPDKSEITATVAEDGTFTLDTCRLTNESTEKYTIEKSSVSIAQDATDIVGLDQTNLTINGFSDGKIVFTGNPGDSSEFTPTDLEDLASGVSTTLSFAIDLPDDVDIETLLDKQVFTISLTPKEVINWIPMQAEIHDGSKIDFYPAFSTKDQIAGYKFAVKGADGKYTEILSDDITMKKIYEALQPQSDGAKTTTLYYQKTSSNAQEPKCYTVKDMTWNYVFGTKIQKGEANTYDQGFINDYQYDKSGKLNGITTALLDGYFGSKWNQTRGSVIPELANSVKYIDDKGSVPSDNGGFYGCYGGSAGGLLSDYSNCPWGCCANASGSAFFFNVKRGVWANHLRGDEYGVVLARAFN